MVTGEENPHRRELSARTPRAGRLRLIVVCRKSYSVGRIPIVTETADRRRRRLRTQCFHTPRICQGNVGSSIPRQARENDRLRMTVASACAPEPSVPLIPSDSASKPVTRGAHRRPSTKPSLHRKGRLSIVFWLLSLLPIPRGLIPESCGKVHTRRCGKIENTRHSEGSRARKLWKNSCRRMRHHDPGWRPRRVRDVVGIGLFERAICLKGRSR